MLLGAKRAMSDSDLADGIDFDCVCHGLVGSSPELIARRRCALTPHPHQSSVAFSPVATRSARSRAKAAFARMHATSSTPSLSKSGPGCIAPTGSVRCLVTSSKAPTTPTDRRRPGLKGLSTIECSTLLRQEMSDANSIQSSTDSSGTRVIFPHIGIATPHHRRFAAEEHMGLIVPRAGGAHGADCASRGEPIAPRGRAVNLWRPISSTRRSIGPAKLLPESNCYVPAESGASLNRPRAKRTPGIPNEWDHSR